MAWGSTVMIGSAVIRRDDEILLVREARDQAADTWGIPGGVVEPGELVTEAVIREVKEETGLVINRLGSLAIVSQHFQPGFENALTALAFEVEEFDGEVAVDDPDGVVKEAAWFSIADAILEMEKATPGPGREPFLAYLRDGAVGAAWMWRVSPNGARLIARV